MTLACLLRAIHGYQNSDGSTPGYDYVICRLDTPLGDTNTCGFIGSEASQGNDLYYNGIWTSVGYPRFANLQPVVQESIKIEDVDTQLYDFKKFESEVYQDHGWSGGPLWAFVGGQPLVIGVLSGLEGEPSLDPTTGFVAEHAINAGGPAFNALVSYGRSNWN